MPNCPQIDPCFFFPDLKSINNIYIYTYVLTMMGMMGNCCCYCCCSGLHLCKNHSIQGEVNHTNKTFDGSHVFRLYCEGNVAWEQYFLGSCLPVWSFALNESLFVAVVVVVAVVKVGSRLLLLLPSCGIGCFFLLASGRGLSGRVGGEET